ncbi:MAG: GTPase HflX [Peptostreptococcaceae bacterium]|nr:GTPase HflX [Peptostreptococcaceae bacterium]
MPSLKVISGEGAGQREKMILAGLNVTNRQKSGSSTNIYESMKELEELAVAAGGEVLGSIVQNKDSYDAAYYIGKGKAEEIKAYAENLGADIVVFNEELSGAQIRNLEELIGVSVIDRTALILDIFAGRALSKEGKLQVELAQHKYRLPRLTGEGIAMSRTGGGIGTRGPGEKKLETDKRHIRERINDIRRELKEISKNREIQRSQRLKSNLPIIALVGYTNAGKSTIMNELIKTHRDYSEDKAVFAKDMLFATLDVSLRKAVLPCKQEYLITDTVGFVSELPHDLIEAFKATLEEVRFADALVHVVDASNEHLQLQIETTLSVLRELGVEDKPMLYVFNKADKVSYELEYKPKDPFVFISAATGYNMEIFVGMIEKMILSRRKKVELKIPYTKGEIVSLLHQKYHFEEEYREDGAYFEVDLDEVDYGRYHEYIAGKEQ